jgi:hypothetical protein
MALQGDGLTLCCFLPQLCVTLKLFQLRTVCLVVIAVDRNMPHRHSPVLTRVSFTRHYTVVTGDIHHSIFIKRKLTRNTHRSFAWNIPGYGEAGGESNTVKINFIIGDIIQGIN